MSKIIWGLVTVLVGVAIYMMLFKPDIIVGGIVHAAPACTDTTTCGKCAGYPNGVCESCTIGQCGGKDACDPNALPADYEECQKDTTPPDPNRPYFDGWGNEFDYMGNLIKAAPCTTDPISKVPNPYSCPIPTPVVPTPTSSDYVSGGSS